MLWYGFISYFFVFSVLFLLIFFFLKLLHFYSLNKLNFQRYLINLMLAILSFFFLISLFSSFFFLNFFFNIVSYSNFFYLSFYDNNAQVFLNKNVSLNFNLLNIYYFPFIYIFIIVTVLSIFFCLTYSIGEINLFSFYCGIILIFGYILFFTDSLILFFLSYEMLLVPSFLILYKFAKTRRCVEAAYLMFF